MTEDTKPQADKFRDMARELEADENEAAFEEKVRRVASSGGHPTKSGKSGDHDQDRD